MAITRIALSGSYQDAQGNAATGYVDFTLSSPIRDPDGNIIVAADTQRVELSNGALSVTLYATDEPTAEPDGVTYTVHERINGEERTYSIELPYSGGAVNLADVVPVESATITYGVTQAELTAHSADTTSVHGIADTAQLVTFADLAIEALIVSGAASVDTDVLPPGQRIPYATTLNSVYARCGTAPTGSALTVAVKRNGTQITTVSIAAGATSGSTTGLAIALAAGDVISYGITAIGSSTAGADIAVQLVGS